MVVDGALTNEADQAVGDGDLADVGGGLIVEGEDPVVGDGHLTV